LKATITRTASTTAQKVNRRTGYLTTKTPGGNGLRIRCNP
jgi:hypothetical protein